MAKGRPRRRGKAMKAAASRDADKEAPSPGGKPLPSSSPATSPLTPTSSVLSLLAALLSVAVYYAVRGGGGGGGGSPVGAGNATPDAAPAPGVGPSADARRPSAAKTGCHPDRRHLCSAEELRLAIAAAGHFERGNRLLAAGRTDEAREAFEASLSIDATSAFAAGAMQNLGRVLAQLGEGDASREALRDAVRLDGESVHARLGLAVSLGKTRAPADWHEADGHCAVALDLLSGGRTAEEERDRLHGILATNHGMVLRRIAARDPDLTPAERRLYLDRATRRFETTVGLARDGRVPRPLASNAVVYLQDLLRSDDGGPSPRRDALLDWAVDAAGLWGDRRQLPAQFNRALYDAAGGPLRPWIDDPEGRFPALRPARERWRGVRDEYVAAAGSRGTVRPVGERVDFDAELYDRRGGEDWSEVPILSGDGAGDDPDVAPLVASLFRGLVPPLGSVTFSSVTTGTHIKPHCGPTNEMVTCHLGLIVPEDASIDELGIVAGGEPRGWTEGEWMCFEDSMEHAVWNRSGGTRVVLIVQLRHYLLG